jgi:hypothetical protein
MSRIGPIVISRPVETQLRSWKIGPRPGSGEGIGTYHRVGTVRDLVASDDRGDDE